MMLAGADDAPVATQVRPPAPAPAAAPPQAPPPMISASQLNMSVFSPATAPPSDDYGYVAWCYGVLSGYIALYDTAMPEVTRIEREFPGPDGADEDLKIYPQLRAQARMDLKLYTLAIEAAEEASPRPIAAYGSAAARRGMAVWNGARNAPKAKLAQMWMSWSPPDRCEVTALRLKSKASVLGQALAANTPDASSLDTSDAPALAKVTSAAAALTFQPLSPPASAPLLAPGAPAASPKAPVAKALLPAPEAPEPAKAAVSAEMPPAAPSLPAAAPAAAPASAAAAVAEPPAAPPVPMPPPVTTPPGPPEPDPSLWYRGVP